MDAPLTDTVQLSVELPSYLYSFTVDAPLNGSVADVKALVHQRCTGNPSVEGQRIIWRGRALGNAEKVEDLWKVSFHINNDTLPRACHLSRCFL